MYFIYIYNLIKLYIYIFIEIYMLRYMCVYPTRSIHLFLPPISFPPLRVGHFLGGVLAARTCFKISGCPR